MCNPCARRQSVSVPMVLLAAGFELVSLLAMYWVDLKLRCAAAELMDCSEMEMVQSATL